MKRVKNIRIWKDKGCVVAVKLKLFENLQHFGRFASCYERQPASLSVWLDWAYHSDQDMECEHRTQRMVLMPHFFGLRFLRCMTGVHRAINAIRAKDGQAADPGLGGKPDRRAAWTRTGWHAIRAIHINTRDVCNIDLERAVSCLWNQDQQTERTPLLSRQGLHALTERFQKDFAESGPSLSRKFWHWRVR